MGTTPPVFERYKYRHGQKLAFDAGASFGDLFDGMSGAAISVAPGLAWLPCDEPADKPFRVAGILAKTGTPVDRTVLVSLAAIEAIHVDWQSGMPVPGEKVPADQVR